MMRLERFFGVAHRNVDVFSALNDALSELYTLAGNASSSFCLPVNFSFFHKEFGRFSEMAQSNDAVACVLRNFCVCLESVGAKDASLEEAA